MPEVSTEAMNLFLAAFSNHLAADEHALISLDQAGWHGAQGAARACQPGRAALALPARVPPLASIARRLRRRRRGLLPGLEPIDARTYPFALQLSLHPTGQRIGSVVSYPQS
jgi:hypothetical protein